MSETGREDVRVAADRLLEAVRSHIFDCDGHQTKITFSMGGSVFPDQSKDKMELIKFADKALCRAKAMGRDRLVFNSPST